MALQTVPDVFLSHVCRPQVYRRGSPSAVSSRVRLVVAHGDVPLATSRWKKKHKIWLERAGRTSPSTEPRDHWIRSSVAVSDEGVHHTPCRCWSCSQGPGTRHGSRTDPDTRASPADCQSAEAPHGASRRSGAWLQAAVPPPPPHPLPVEIMDPGVKKTGSELEGLLHVRVLKTTHLAGLPGGKFFGLFKLFEF